MISLLHPSRGRSFKAFATYESWINKSSGKYTIEHILSVDTDDHELDSYHTLFRHSKLVVAPNHNLVEATNVGAKECTGDIIVLLSDDFECFPNWDIEIVKAFEGKSGYVLKTNDGQEGWIVTLPIMDKEYYKTQDYFYHPETKHLFCDTIMTHKAELEDRLIIRNDLVFIHRHPMNFKNVPMDESYMRSNKTWEQGKQIYLRECLNNFGLGPSIDIYNLSYSAIPHIKWLRNELGK